MRSDLMKIRQLAAAAAWQTPLGDDIYELATRLLQQLDDEADVRVVELRPQRPHAHLRAA